MFITHYNTLISYCALARHLAADAESLQWVEAEPAGVPCLSEAVHELCVERPLQGRQTHQDHVLLFRGKVVLQDVMTSPGTNKVMVNINKMEFSDLRESKRV